ncbi:type VI secretion system-associated FHA domain protein TagH [Bradyrhizobium sp.]|uniref:type VI secretion system-associated FHA domain protein TagH n=1 Tax=Bradyrhizobium sp. TaxID=376 RepID=UPI00345CBE3F
MENEVSLPDGGPLSVSIKGRRGLDIGRDPYLDWTLPDPSRFISGRHCEVRWRDGAYWLHDVSTNGTFMNGAESRLKAPHRLRDGDRFVIGQYIIATTLEEELAEPGEAVPAYAPPSDEALWDAAPAAAPIDPQQLKTSRELAAVRPDFLDWATDVPVPIVSAVARPSASLPSVGSGPAALDLERDGWAAGPPPPPAPQPNILPQPMPRRPRAEGAQPRRAAAAEPEPPASLPSSLIAGAEDGADADFVRRVARGAGLPENAFAGRDTGELAEQFGRLLRLATDNMKQLLEARQQAKQLARSPSQTTVQATDNNPLKFAPTAEDALRIMFGAKGQSYLDAEKAFAQGFDDLKRHQIRTYTAMQQAVARLMKDVDPAAIEAASQSDRGLAGMVGSRKARLWDVYVARWQAQAGRHDNGMLDAFMNYFARCYGGE